jgi:hypothetical protein
MPSRISCTRCALNSHYKNKRKLAKLADELIEYSQASTNERDRIGREIEKEANDLRNTLGTH